MPLYFCAYVKRATSVHHTAVRLRRMYGVDNEVLNG